MSSSNFQIKNSTIQLHNGSLGGGFWDNSTFLQQKVNYISTQFPMTIALAGNSQISIDSCSGGMEFVLQDSTNLQITNSRTFVIWNTISENDTAHYALPPANSVYNPIASDVSGVYQFPMMASYTSGIHFNFLINNTDEIYWGVFSDKNSKTMLTNTTLIACGFFFKGNADETVSNFINDSLYTSYTAQISDRIFSVSNSKIFAWNFYTLDSAKLTIKESFYGESLSFGKSHIDIFNSTCDGNGGYWGGQDSSTQTAYNCIITRPTNVSAPIINLYDSHIARLSNSKIQGKISLSANSQLYLGNVLHDSVPNIRDNSFFAEILVDSLPPMPLGTNSIIELMGKVHGINGPMNNSKITRYIIEYSNLDSTGKVVLKDSSSTDFDFTGTLANLNTSGLPLGEYLLWGTLFVDGDTAISCARKVDITISRLAEFEEVQAKIYPNPVRSLLKIELDEQFEAILLDLNGKELKRKKGKGKVEFDLSQFLNGIYLLKIQTESASLSKKIEKN